jgi:hypothetical protein
MKNKSVPFFAFYTLMSDPLINKNRVLQDWFDFLSRFGNGANQYCLSVADFPLTVVPIFL